MSISFTEFLILNSIGLKVEVRFMVVLRVAEYLITLIVKVQQKH